MDDKILTIISETCENCPSHENCPEDSCPLYVIEQIIINKEGENDENKN